MTNLRMGFRHKQRVSKGQKKIKGIFKKREIKNLIRNTSKKMFILPTSWRDTLKTMWRFPLTAIRDQKTMHSKPQSRQ